MLTPAQQKIRQELEELQVKSLFLTEKEPNPSGKKDPRVKWEFYILGLFLLILVCSLGYKEYSTQKQENIDLYLTEVQELNSQSNQLMEDFLNQEQLRADYLRDKQQVLLQDAENLKAPSSFTDYHQDLIELIKERDFILSSSTIAQNDLMELQVKEELALDSLQKALAAEHIKTSVLGNGLLKFKIHTTPVIYGK